MFGSKLLMAGVAEPEDAHTDDIFLQRTSGSARTSETFSGVNLAGGTTKLISLAVYAQNANNGLVSATIAGVPATIFEANTGGAWESAFILMATGVSAQSGDVVINMDGSWSIYQGNYQIAGAAFTTVKTTPTFAQISRANNSGAVDILVSTGGIPYFAVGALSLNKNGASFLSEDDLVQHYSGKSISAAYSGALASAKVPSGANRYFSSSFTGSQQYGCMGVLRVT